MPKLLDNKCNVAYLGLIHYDASQFDYSRAVTMVMMMFDVTFSEYDESVPGRISANFMFIIDAKGFTLRHFLNVVKNISTVRLFMKYIQEAVPFHIKKLNFINGSFILDKLIALIKPFMSKELMEALVIHTSLDTLYDLVPKDNLPSELGGDLGSKFELHQKFLELFVSKR